MYTHTHTHTHTRIMVMQVSECPRASKACTPTQALPQAASRLTPGHTPEHCQVWVCDSDAGAWGCDGGVHTHYPLHPSCLLFSIPPTSSLLHTVPSRSPLPHSILLPRSFFLSLPALPLLPFSISRMTPGLSTSFHPPYLSVKIGRASCRERVSSPV